MEYILINREGDAKIIADYKTSFETYTLKELVKAYNKEAKCGIVGVHRQALYLAALVSKNTETRSSIHACRVSFVFTHALQL